MAAFDIDNAGDNYDGECCNPKERNDLNFSLPRLLERLTDRAGKTRDDAGKNDN